MMQWRGLLRSILMYYGNPFKVRRMRRFYAQFIKPGDLCFDIGAHVGNRVWMWSRLGAKVLAVEPQPACFRLLERWYGRAANVTLLEQAVGAAPGSATLWVSAATPTVSTLSSAWIDAVRQVDSFAHVRWQPTQAVAVVTLDQLIDRYGAPAFCKIDVEGYEQEVLAGLSQALPALSFEYIPATIELALVCVERLAQLGEYEYNWSLGEQHRWQSAHWLAAKQLTAFLKTLAPDAPSGDIYARLANDTAHGRKLSSLERVQDST
jgi:FkbM family methyltransferase